MSTENNFTCIDPEFLKYSNSTNLNLLVKVFNESNHNLFDYESKKINSWDSIYTFDPASFFNSIGPFLTLVVENQIDLTNPDFSNIPHNETKKVINFYNEISKLLYFFQNSYRTQEQKLNKNES